MEKYIPFPKSIKCVSVNYIIDVNNITISLLYIILHSLL